jgi:hypothetical protein
MPTRQKKPRSGWSRRPTRAVRVVDWSHGRKGGQRWPPFLFAYGQRLRRLVYCRLGMV